MSELAIEYDGPADVANGVCCCCLGIGRFRSISRSYDWLGTTERYADMLLSCFNISVPRADGDEEVDAQLMCAVCITRLRDAHNFRRQIETSVERLESTREIGGVLHFNKLLTQLKSEAGGANDADSRRLRNDAKNEDAGAPRCDDSENDSQEELNLDQEAVDASERCSDDQPSEDAEAGSNHGEDYIIAIEIEDEVKKDGADLTPADKSARRLRHRKKRTAPPDEDYEPKKKSAKKKTVKEPRTLRRRKSLAASPEKEHRQEERALKCNAALVISCSEVCPFKCLYNVVRCFYCSVEFADPAELRAHTAISHLTDKPNAHQYLPNSLVSVDVTVLDCSLCDFTPKDLDQLLQHLVDEHDKSANPDYGSGVIPYRLTESLRCYVCSSEYQTFQALCVHMNEHYNNNVCDVCGATYASRSRLAKHATTHTKGSYKCALCEKVYDSPAKRRCHMEVVHERKAKSLCRICGERFKDYDQKMMHLIRVHKQPPMQFKCQYCDNVYVTRRLLMNHTRRDHLKVRNHKCDVCDKTFYLKSQLDQHVVVHTGQMGFECSVCERRFNGKANLTTHMALHTGVRPHACQVCPATFITAGHLQWHMKTHHASTVLYY